MSDSFFSYQKGGTVLAIRALFPILGKGLFYFLKVVVFMETDISDIRIYPQGTDLTIIYIYRRNYLWKKQRSTIHGNNCWWSAH